MFMITQQAITRVTKGIRASANAAPAEVKAAESNLLQGGWLLLARTLWAVIVALAVGMFAIAIPARYGQLLALTNLFDVIWRKQVNMGWRSDVVRASLDHLGLSASFYANFTSILEVACAFVFLMVAVVIFHPGFRIHAYQERASIVRRQALQGSTGPTEAAECPWR
jgi:hypothetical protein